MQYKYRHTNTRITYQLSEPVYIDKMTCKLIQVQ